MEYWQVTVTICQHIIITLHTILVSTHNFVTARPHNDIFALLPCLQEKSKSCAFVPRRVLSLATKGLYITRSMSPSSCVAVIFVALFISADHVDQKATCIVSYPAYYHSYAAARISASITALGSLISVSLESVVVAWFTPLRIRFVPVT